MGNKKTYTKDAARARVRLFPKEEMAGRFLTALEVACVFNVSPRTVLRWASEGWPPAKRIGKTSRLWRFDGSLILEILEADPNVVR